MIYDIIYQIAFSLSIIEIIPYQDLKKDHDKEMLAIVEASKVKKEVARGGKCLKKIWIGILSVTGELFNCLPKHPFRSFEGIVDNSLEG